VFGLQLSRGVEVRISMFFIRYCMDWSFEYRNGLWGLIEGFVCRDGASLRIPVFESCYIVH